MVGHVVERFELSREPTFIQPSQASGAVAYHMEQSASYPIGSVYFGPQATVSGAMLVDSSSERGRELGPCLNNVSSELCRQPGLVSC